MSEKRDGKTQDWSFTIWGCRGSVPVAGSEYLRHGGATTCVELDLPGARIIVDAGSGMADLGRRRGVDRKPTLLLLTHLHWDHIIGLPHFVPLYVPGWTLDVRGVPRSGQSVWSALAALNRPPIFPVAIAETARAEVRAEDLPETGATTFHGVRLEWAEVGHPGGCSAFAFEVEGQRLVFCTDVEIARADRAALVQFARGATVFICDAQYTEQEYPGHDGWGHSTASDAAAVARDAGVGRLILTHHDPAHDDDFIDAMEKTARAIFPSTDAAHDGMVAAGSPAPR